MTKMVIYDLIQIFKASVSSVIPKNLIKQNVIYDSASKGLNIAGKYYSLQDKSLYVVGAGKAVQDMAIEINNILGTRVKEGIISIPKGSLKQTQVKNIMFYEGAADNLPDEKSQETAKKIKDLVTNLTANDMLIVLISGGGSALLPLPKYPVTLAEKTDLIKRLANSGADIKELNIVRKKISDVKGGSLGIQAQPAKVVSLILSDIICDPLDLIASGPTVENKDDTLAASNIIKKYNLEAHLPNSVKLILDNFTSDRFPTENVDNNIIGSNKISVEAARNEAIRLNYFPIVLSNTVNGNVKNIAKQYVMLTKAICFALSGKPNKYDFSELDSLSSNINYKSLEIITENTSVQKGICLILGGEPTVEVKGTGKGGRNQQLALEFSYLLHCVKETISSFDIFFLSAGTDGIDGPTDAAGAIGYIDLMSDAIKENLDPISYINNNDSYNFYKQFQHGQLHIITGHTNTNVMDTHLIVIRKKL